MPDQSPEKSLIIAAESGDTATVAQMLAAGADPNAMGPQSGSLHVAAFGDHLAIVKLLLANGGNPNLPDVRGFYPLQLAASKGRAQVAAALIAAGADLEAKTKHGGTALHVAAASNFPAVVALLLDAGAEIEARDAGGNTALATACGLGSLAAFEELENAGANMKTLSDGEETLLIKVARGIKVLRVKSWFSQASIDGVPVQYAIKNGIFTSTQNGVTKELSEQEQRDCASQDWGPKGHLAYLNAIVLGQRLIAEKFSPNDADASGHTAFSLACHAGVGILIHDMIKAGAVDHITHEEGFQPIHLVAGSGSLSGLWAYVNYTDALKVNAVDAYGWTPLHWLADIGGDRAMATLLLEAGADKAAKSTKVRGGDMPIGITPTEVAAHWGDAEMAEALKIS